MMGHPDAGRYVSRRFLIEQRVDWFLIGALAMGWFVAGITYLVGA